MAVIKKIITPAPNHYTCFPYVCPGNLPDTAGSGDIAVERFKAWRSLPALSTAGVGWGRALKWVSASKFDFPLKGEPLNKAGKKNSQQRSVRKGISARVEKLVEKKSSSLKFGLKKIEKGRVCFSMFIRLWSALLKWIPRLFPLTTLRFTSRSGLWASKLDSFQIKFNWKMCSRSTANALQTVSNV